MDPGLIAFIAVAVVLFLASITIIPTAHFGVVVLFTKRTGRRLKEGLRFVIPLIERVELFSIELEADTVKAEFVCKDDVELFVEGPLQWRPDQDITYLEDGVERVRFVEMKEETIINGIVGEIRSTLGRIGGQKDSREIYNNRREVETLVNCVLRLEFPPHLFPDYKYEKGDKKGDLAYPWAKESRHRYKNEKGEDIEVEHVKNGEVPTENQIEFFKVNAQKIRALLEEESEDTGSHSPVERRYGIDIEKFALADVDLTPKYKAVIQQKQEADARAEAARNLAKVHKELTAHYINELKMKPNEASNRASLALGLSAQAITSIEGLEGSAAIPFFQIQTPQPKKGDG